MLYHIYQKQKEKNYRVEAYNMKDLINLTKYMKVLLSSLLRQLIQKRKKEDCSLKSVP